MSMFKYIYTLAEGLIGRIFDEILKNIKTLRKEDGDRQRKDTEKKAIVNKNPHGFQKPDVKRMFLLHADNQKIKKDLTLFFVFYISK